MDILNAVFLTLAISHLAIVLIFLLAQRPKQYLNQLIAALLVCLIAYLLGNAPGELLNHSVTDYTIRRIGNVCPILLWLIAHELFEDKESISPAVWLFSASYLLLRAVGAVYFQVTAPLDPSILLLTYVVPQIIMIAFILHALYTTIRGYSADLMNARRHERIVFVAGSIALLVLMLANSTYQMTNLMLNTSLGTSYSTSFLIPVYFYSAYIYIGILIFCFWRFRLFYPPKGTHSKEHEGQSKSGAPLVNIKNRDLKVVENITHVMEVHKLYLSNKLTVKDLAKHISSQEYRVRRAINEHMLYRNFSDFINHYRILDAGRRLIETEEPISNIGLDVGYTSLSAFHKAFKEKYAVTPKEYRIRQQANTPQGTDMQSA